jgi:hypothetical protein
LSCSSVNASIKKELLEFILDSKRFLAELINSPA